MFTMTKRQSFEPIGAVLRRVAAKLAAQRNSMEKNTAPTQTQNVAAVSAPEGGTRGLSTRAAANDGAATGEGEKVAAPTHALGGGGEVQKSRNGVWLRRAEPKGPSTRDRVSNVIHIAKAASVPRYGCRSVGEQVISAPLHACSPFVSGASNFASTASAAVFSAGSTSTQNGARAQACIAVVWSRFPKTFPIIGSE